MKKWFFHYAIIIPILLVLILYYIIQMVDPKFKAYVQGKEETDPSEKTQHNIIQNTKSTLSDNSDAQTILQKTDKNISLLKTDIQNILQSLSHPIEASILAKVLSSPFEFLQDIQLVYKYTSPMQYMLVDKQSTLNASYVPQDIVSLDDYQDLLVLNKNSMQVSKSIIENLLAMHKAAKEDAIVLDISSAYRSYEYQKNLFNYYTNELGVEEASRISAKPGTSQHQLGTTLDYGCICSTFASTEAGKWIANNAWKYGFSLSYPQGMEDITGYVYESWHYRHIGITASSFEHTYFNNRGQQYTLEILSEKTQLEELIRKYL